MDSDEEYGSLTNSSYGSDVEIYDGSDDASASPTYKSFPVREYHSDDGTDSSSSIYVTGDSDHEAKAKYLYDDIGNVQIDEVKRKSPSPRKGFTVQCPSKWSPKIKSVCGVPHGDMVKDENGHLVLVNEDEIKQEEELLNEDDEDAMYKNELHKSIFAEYPNLKIKDEFEFKGCSIKLEKLDFSHLQSVDPLVLESPIQESIKSTNSIVSSGRKRGRPRKTKQTSRTRRGRRSKIAEKSTRSRSRRDEKTRRSSRLKNKTVDSPRERTAETEENGHNTSVPDRKTTTTNQRKRRFNGKQLSEGRHSDAAVLSDCDTDNSSRSLRSKKAAFMEANGLTNTKNGTFALKNNNLNSQTPPKKVKKKVSFADVNGTIVDKEATREKDIEQNQKKTPEQEKPEKEEPEKDPAKEYKLAIKKYSSEVDTYKLDLNVYYECLCCDRKYHLIDHCKEHVRTHFPGLLTN